jgi:hypothetical protein
MSEIRAATVSNLAGTGPVTLTGQSAAKAWVNFNGTGTVAIRESANVSSITDNAVGEYRANYTNSFADANYSGQATTSQHVGVTSDCTSTLAGGSIITSSCEIVIRSNGSVAFDPVYVGLTIHR